jgi:hypothetical protein
VSSKGNIVKDLIDRGMAPIRADLARFAAALGSMSASSEDPSAAAVEAVRSARDHAAAAETSLTTANQGHIRLIPGGAQAIRAFIYLGQGLTVLEQALTSPNGSTVASLTTKAKGLIDRANDELLAADRALGCPYGCRPAPLLPKPGAKP